jgi:small ligand-binding sensory domain FIST
MTTPSPALFLSAAAAGSDWREAARAVAERLQAEPAALESCTIGFLYMTDALGAEAQNILDFLREVTGIAHWVGATGIGVLGVGGAYIDAPAIAVMAAALPPESFRVFPPVEGDTGPALQALAPWLQEQEPMLVLLHGDPLADTDPALTLAAVAQDIGGYTAGGLASARGLHVQIADGIVEGGLSGAAFAQEVEVVTALSQGCAPLGPAHRITGCEDNVVMELDGRPAFEVLSEDVRALALSGTPAAHADEDGGITIRGEVHVAFPVPGRDHQDYTVRHALGIDPERGWIAVAQPVHEGMTMMFVHRDDDTVRADLARTLVDLRRRVTRERGTFAPRGALYISCVARAGVAFDDGDRAGEMGLVREILGDVPLAGFYANGEIANGTLYGYTAVVILFL